MVVAFRAIFRCNYVFQCCEKPFDENFREPPRNNIHITITKDDARRHSCPHYQSPVNPPNIRFLGWLLNSGSVMLA